MPTFRKVLSDRVKEHHAALAARARGEDVSTYLPTGISKWDANGGIDKGVLTIIAGPSGEGKSAVMMAICRAIALKGMRALVLSFEDPAGKTADRTLAALTGVGAHTLGRMEYDNGVLTQLAAAYHAAKEWADNIEFHAGLLDITQAKQAVLESDADLVVIDYAQALPDGDQSRERMLSEFGWFLNKDAQDKRRACVLFSQTVAEIEDRGAKRFERDGTVDGYRPGPGKSDLSWAKALGERCKCLVYIFRPGRWGRAKGLQVRDDTMEIIVTKANFGQEGTIKCTWHGPTASITD